MTKNTKKRLFVITSGIAFVVLAPFLKHFHWLIDLFTHFQTQALVLSALFLVISVWRKWKKTSAVYAVFVACVTLRLFWPSLTAEALRNDHPAELSVTTVNVFFQNQEHQAVSRHLLQSKTDVIVAVEITPQWEGSLLDALSDTYPYHVKQARVDSFGMLLLSRYPLSETSISSLGSYGLPMVSAVVEAPRGKVKVFGVHPIPPMGAQDSENNFTYFSAVAERVKMESVHPVLVLGDFNATPWSAQYSDLISTTQLQNAAARQPFVTTWSPIGIPVMGLQLDHVLYSSELGLSDVTVGPFHHSDHRSVTARFFWKKQP